ncbi:hypothetical protein L1987_10309 [Smallanthus sonchifolius]|uniref:Uncharacterized protein n=1 Tax=Smallanthus sonchifolius TaxID=185202 RepID=A0ACB9JRR5_9ASTR|nr:hypothetical protein L1987_10309 [Smallanthus sonchifolius]
MNMPWFGMVLVVYGVMKIPNMCLSRGRKMSLLDLLSEGSIGDVGYQSRPFGKGGEHVLVTHGLNCYDGESLRACLMMLFLEVVLQRRQATSSKRPPTHLDYADGDMKILDAPMKDLAEGGDESTHHSFGHSAAKSSHVQAAHEDLGNSPFVPGWFVTVNKDILGDPLVCRHIVHEFSSPVERVKAGAPLAVSKARLPSSEACFYWACLYVALKEEVAKLEVQREEYQAVVEKRSVDMVEKVAGEDVVAKVLLVKDVTSGNVVDDVENATVDLGGKEARDVVGDAGVD